MSDVGQFRTVLVDTSLLIEQQKRESVARPVRERLGGYHFKGASSYSKLEFKSAWLQRLAFIHEKCRTGEAKSVADLMAILNRSIASPYQQRRVQTCFDALIEFLSTAGRAVSDRAEVRRLQAHCKNAVLSSAAAMGRMVTGEFKGTQCVRAEEGPEEHEDGSLNVAIRKCNPEHIHCAVHKFFAENEALFARIADYVDGREESSDELKRMRDHIRLAQKNPVHLCNRKHCGKLADVLIAVDGKNMAVFAANNDREWIPIASVMGKPLVNPVSGQDFPARAAS